MWKLVNRHGSRCSICIKICMHLCKQGKASVCSAWLSDDHVLPFQQLQNMKAFWFEAVVRLSPYASVSNVGVEPRLGNGWVLIPVGELEGCDVMMDLSNSLCISCVLWRLTICYYILKDNMRVFLKLLGDTVFSYIFFSFYFVLL